jgi:uncharacterized protein with PIN domain
MAKVLKYGKIQPRTTMCPDCEAIIEYTDADLDYTSIPCKFGEDKIGLRCPACGKLLTVEYYRNGLHCIRKEDGKFHVVGRYETDEF